MNDRQLALAALLCGKEIEWQYIGDKFAPEYWWPVDQLSMAASIYIATGMQCDGPPVRVRIKPEETE